MCNFFSFKTNGMDKIYYFSGEQRKANNLCFKNGDKVSNWDSHTSIETYYGLKNTDWSSGEYNPFSDKLVIDQQHTEWNEQKVRGILAKVDWTSLCGDLEGARKFIIGLKDIKWFDNHGKVPDGVMMFETRDETGKAALSAAWEAVWNAARNGAWKAARDAASDAAWDAVWNAAWDAVWNAARDAVWNAARNAAWDAVWDAVWDAALYANVLFTCARLNIDQRHIDYIQKRWSIWEAGYGVDCDVDGVLYCYKRL